MTLPVMSEITSDGKIWVAAARVELHDGESQHYAISEGQLHISVVTLKHGVPLWAQMPSGSQDGSGLWRIPSINTEVCLGFDCGEFEGDAYVIGVIGRPVDQLIEGETLLLDDKVIVRSVNGQATSFAALQSELHALWEYVRAQFSSVGGHSHTVVGGSTTTTTTVSPPGGSPPTVPPSEPVGSLILEVE